MTDVGWNFQVERVDLAGLCIDAGQRQGGRKLKVGQGQSAYWAFVPHPLPPALIFTLYPPFDKRCE